ncbi:hypothetical protein [Polynucleobacter sp.]|uniref:hypothetical protein n=1 Tax=Polynucleobacter sp. TaxID=2029855 RepID=UPI00334137BB
MNSTQMGNCTMAFLGPSKSMEDAKMEACMFLTALRTTASASEENTEAHPP